METSKPRILVVDDERDMVAFLEDLLHKAGFDADGASNGEQMHEALARRAYALILLDLRLKSEDGLTLACDLRQRSAIPIIMVSGASDETDRVLLLELAADDVLIKPLPPAKRNVAMVFQGHALYPHMTVHENMAFGLRHQKMPAVEIERHVAEASHILHLDSLLQRRPRDLSCGQRQRVAIGRAIVRKPKVFLFDEPLSNLDAALRVQTRVEIAKLHTELGSASMVYVTHDQIEAMTLADKIVLLQPLAGRPGALSVAQVGHPLDAVPPSGEPICRRVHRIAVDELH